MLKPASRRRGGRARRALEGKVELATVRAEVFLDELRREHVEARRHRRVGREHRPRPCRLERLGERQPVLAHEAADALEAEEGRVALVHVEDDGLEAERAQRAHAADAEHDLLPDAVLLVAAVELVGDVLDVGRVLGDVGVEQVQRHASHVRAPDLHDRRASGEVHLDTHRAFCPFAASSTGML